MIKFKDFVNERKNQNIIKEGTDWIILKSGNVALDSYNLCFMPLVNGLPDLQIPEIEPNNPEYDEIVNKLDNKDRETFEYVKKEAEPFEG